MSLSWGYRKRLQEVAERLDQDRRKRRRGGARRPFDGFPLDRLGTHSFKRSAVVLMKDTCSSTALVGAMAGTTAKTLDRIYDAPTLQRQQGLVDRAFAPAAAALRASDARVAGARRRCQGAAADKFCSQCGNARDAPEWACCPWRGHTF